jgi:hypothetical protein
LYFLFIARHSGEHEDFRILSQLARNPGRMHIKLAISAAFREEEPQ